MRGGQSNVNDLEYEVIHKLKGHHPVEKIGLFLNRSVPAVRAQLKNPLPPSERPTSGKQRGKAPVISDAFKNDVILPLLQESNWRIPATGVHEALEYEHDINWQLKTTERCVRELRIAHGREKEPKKRTKKKHKKAWINDEEHQLIIQLGKHLQPSAIANLMNRSFSTIKSHLADWELPSIKAQRRNKGGRTTDILAGEPKAIIEAALKQSDWTMTGKELHQLLVPKFPHLGKALRTVQRYAEYLRLRDGPEKQIYPELKKKPGEFVQADFTLIKSVVLFIAGIAISLRLLNIVLPYSKHLYSEVVLGGESFQALNNGLANAFAQFNGVPENLITDSLSAGYKNLSKQDQLDWTERFKQLCRHFGIKAQRHNLGCPHEKGCVESINRHFEEALITALMRRKSTNFATKEELQEFIHQVVQQYNTRNQPKIRIEQQYLQDFPTQPFKPYKTDKIWVSKRGGFTRDHVYYSVPSRFSDKTWDARIYSDRIELYHGNNMMFELPRHIGQKGTRTAVINYAHMLDHYRQRPGSFKDFVHLDDFFPREEYQLIYQRTLEDRPAVAACRYVIGLLTIAHEKNCEQELATAIKGYLDDEQLPSLYTVQRQFGYQAQSKHETDLKTARQTPKMKTSLIRVPSQKLHFPAIEQRLKWYNMTNSTSLLLHDYSTLLSPLPNTSPPETQRFFNQSPFWMTDAKTTFTNKLNG